jgi:lipopolysaccharide transport protein LptA
MTGGDRPAGAKTEITATKESSFDSEKNIAEFTGRVVVRDPQFTLTCDRLKVTLSPDRKGIAVAEATGSVIIVQEKSDSKSAAQQAIGRAGEVVYKPDVGEVVLKDWPSIQQGMQQSGGNQAKHNHDPSHQRPIPHHWWKQNAHHRYREAPMTDISGKPLLHTEGLIKIYNRRSVVNGVDINVKKGEIVGLLGPNGAGKTTTFYMIVGLVRPNGGRVFFRGEDVTAMPMYQRARHGMGYLPQEESIFRKLTVEQNILAILETTGLPKKPQGSLRGVA